MLWSLRRISRCGPLLTPLLLSSYLARVFDSTSLALASDHQASAFESTILVVVEDLFQSDVVPHSSFGRLVFTTDLHGVVTLPRLAGYNVGHHEAVLKDVSAGRTRLEEHEESGTASRWKATGWVSV